MEESLARVQDNKNLIETRIAERVADEHCAQSFLIKSDRSGLRAAPMLQTKQTHSA